MLRYLSTNNRSAKAVGLSAAGALLVVMAGAAPALAGQAAQSATGRVNMTPHAVGAAPSVPAGAHAIGLAQASARLDFDVVLQPRNANGLQALATAVSTPGSAQYGHFLTTAQYAARYGQAPATIKRIDSALRHVGLAPGKISANNLVIPVSTTVGQASASLHTRFENYRLASGRMALANTSAPRLPATVARVTQSVIGLNTLLTVQPNPPKAVAHASHPAAASANAAGPKACAAAVSAAGSFGSWTYTQLAKAYSLTGLYAKNHLGRRATIALFELQRYSSKDVRSFQHCYGTSAKVTTVRVNGGSAPGPGIEATLDIDTVIGLAPKAHVLVYEAPGNNFGKSAIDEYTRIVDQRRAQVLSTSYGACEKLIKEIAPGLIKSENTVFQQAALEGISIFAASGDSGSEACNQAGAGNELAVQDPASQPFITGVGGTDLTKLGPKPTERVWNESAISEGAGGGGISSVWRKRSWQKGRGVISRFSSRRPCHAKRGDCREVPDVSASADPSHGYLIFFGGAWTAVGGTSGAAPLWGAMLADIDAQTSHARFDGFLNPRLYRLGKGNLNDVKVGNNDYTKTHGGRYHATTRYDMASGLGTPIATRLAKSLRPR
jgi:subtilase family serine protease